ncbi:hypothetical protein LCGC14_1356890 [marine sediment metagenome]|uniref:Uncharacterized protein n=1 Tax=marine sediment metagenome TaxID=412755 RepID=A0A0F9KV97_9ZZZZ
MLTGVKGNELTKAIGLWRNGDNTYVKEKARGSLRSYFTHRWKIELESDVLTFLVTYYLN